MQFKLKRFLPPTVNRRLRRRALRLCATLALVALLASAASAYTLVMRSGRRIEIPPTFIVTSRTLTYEAAPGINVTLMITGVDIAATERANNEPAGSLLRRAQATPNTNAPAAQSAAAPTTQARRTLTNRDLEARQRARLQSEADYERRRVELGLPSLEEVRRRNSEEAARAREQLQQSERDEAQAESYWRSRSSSLRAEMAALDAEINYLRVRINEDQDFVTTPFTSVTTIGPAFGSFPSRPFGAFPQPLLGGHIGVVHPAGAGGLQVAGRIGFGGGLGRSHPSFRGRAGVPLVAPPVIVGQSVFGPPLATYSAGPFSNYYYPSYEREVLFARLRELEATRAGLQTRWRLLEDEARRAGAMPGWLRP
jgi:hypothetical protein